MRVRDKGTAIERYWWLIIQEKNSEKLQRGVAYTPLSPLVRSMLYKIAFTMNGFFIGQKFTCVNWKSRIFILKKHLFTQNFYIKNIFLQMYIFIKEADFYSYLAV